MDSLIVEELVSRWWWTLPVTIVTICLSIIAIRLSIKFDLNDWQEARRRDKSTKEMMKAIERCGHMWTLYRQGPYSICDKCQVAISTSRLLSAQQYGNPKPLIMHEMLGAYVTLPGGYPITTGWIGARDK